MADLEQQQHPNVMPQHGDTNQSYQGEGAAHGEHHSMYGWAMTPRGILRAVEFLFAIISFGCMADISGFDNYSQFKFLVAVGVLVFIYTFFLMISYVFQPQVDKLCLYQPVIELGLDGIFCVLLLAAGAAAAAEANKKQFDLPDGSSCSILSCSGVPSKTINNIKAAIVFTFFNLLCMMASTFFSWRQNAAEEAKR